MTASEVADPLGAVERLEALRAAIALRARDCGRDPKSVTLVAVTKTFSADEVWPTIARRRPDNLRREPGPGGQDQMARPARPRRCDSARRRVASDRAAAEQQGARGGRAVRRHRDRRPRENRRGARRGDGQGGQAAAPVRRGQHRRRAAEGRRRAARRRRLPRPLPRQSTAWRSRG